MDKSQIGRSGELAIELYALVTSGGEVDIYAPVVDDDHVDLVAGIRGGTPTLGIVDRGKEILEFRARPSGDDPFQHFRIDALQIGPAIITFMRESPDSPK